MRIIDTFLKVLIEEQIIEEKDYDLYYYCADIIFSGMLFYSFIFAIAFVTGQVDITIAYYVGFFAIRYTGGGYHASSSKKCFALSVSVYFVSMVLIYIISKTMCREVMIGVLLGWEFIVWKFAPVDHSNKKFSAQEYIYYKQKSRVFSVVISVLVFIIWKKNFLLACAINVGALVAALSIFVVHTRKEGNRC